MTPIDPVKPWRLIAGMPALLYGGLLILELPGSSNWLLVAAGVLLVAVMVASRLEYPLLPLWPAFVGLFLLSASIFALIEDVVDYAVVPFSDSDIELIMVALIACGYIAWGIMMTRKMLAY